MPLAAVAALLFGSGLGALALQAVWMREFRLVFGASTAASAAVVAVFMAGVGIGNAWLGPRVDRVQNPLRMYAFLELGVVLASAASPWLLDAGRAMYVALGGQTSLGAGGATAVRLLTSVVILGPATILMGGTFPAAAKAVTTADDRQRWHAAVLYGSNTLGAVAGVSLATFVLLPVMGNRTSLMLAATGLALVGASAYLMARRGNAVLVESSKQSNRETQPQIGRATSEPVTALRLLLNERFVYAAAGIVGFAFFLMELVWYRMLAPILGGTTFTFGVILVVALLGIGLGGITYAVGSRYVKPSLTAFAVTCSLEALCIAIPFAAGDSIALLAAGYHEAAGGFASQVSGWFMVTSLVVLPGSLVSGVQFPLLLALAGQGNRNLGRQVGWTMAANTGGAILGSLAGGFGLLPMLSAPGAWLAVVGILGTLALASLLASRRRGPMESIGRVQMGIAILATVLAATCIWTTGPTAVWRHGGIGAGRFKLPKEPNALTSWTHATRRQLLWQAEGVEASVALMANDGLSFFINGKSDGSALWDAGTQIMLGMLPATLHSTPQKALVVGLGTGETAGWLAEVPSMKRVDVVELEPAIAEVARRCGPVNHDAMRHPKVRILYNDAREVLLTTTERYDIIASEPSNPYRAGIANLFTREFYLSSRERLNQDGLFVQWVQGYEIDEQTVRTIFATLRSVFDHVEVWQSRHDDMLLVCSRHPLQYPAELLRQRVKQEPYRSALAFGWRAVEVEDLFASFVAGPKLVDELAQHEAGRINTDNHNLIEYGFARTVGQTTGFSIAALRKRAVASHADRPKVQGKKEIDWDKVEAYRLVAHTLLARGLLAGAPTPKHRSRAEVLRRYWAADVAGMITAWEHAGYEPLFPTETAILALGYADLGNDRARKFTARLRSWQPIEADAIDAHLALKQGRLRDAGELTEQVFRRLHTNPWGFTHAVETCFQTAIRVAYADRSFAPRLYRAVSEPFAVYAYEETRLWTKLALAELVGPCELLEAVEAYEPHVPWNEEFLKNSATGIRGRWPSLGSPRPNRPQCVSVPRATQLEGRQPMMQFPPEHAFV